MAKKKSALGDYDGRPISKIIIAVTNAGDGLSKGLAIDPEQIHIGDTKHVVLRTIAAKATFAEDPDDSASVICKMSLKANLATLVDAELVAAVLDAQQEKLDEAAGRQRIPFEDDQTGDPGED